MQIDEILVKQDVVELRVKSHPRIFGFIEKYNEKTGQYKIRYYCDKKYVGMKVEDSFDLAKAKLIKVLKEIVEKETRIIKSFENYNLLERYNNDSTWLMLDGQKLTEFPKKYLPLPDTLNYLECCHNQLTELPDLPDSLLFFYCYDNKLTKLPKLPKNLKLLSCCENNITEFPELPNSLEDVFCDFKVMRSISIKNIVEINICFSDNNKHNIPFNLLSNNEINEYVDYRVSLDQIEYKYLPDNLKTKYIKGKYKDLEAMKQFDLL